jgi:hypothetical protein
MLYGRVVRIDASGYPWADLEVGRSEFSNVLLGGGHYEVGDSVQVMQFCFRSWMTPAFSFFHQKVDKVVAIPGSPEEMSHYTIWWPLVPVGHTTKH